MDNWNFILAMFFVVTWGIFLYIFINSKKQEMRALANFAFSIIFILTIVGMSSMQYLMSKRGCAVDISRLMENGVYKAEACVPSGSRYLTILKNPDGLCHFYSMDTQLTPGEMYEIKIEGGKISCKAVNESSLRLPLPEMKAPPPENVEAPGLPNRQYKEEIPKIRKNYG